MIQVITAIKNSKCQISPNITAARIHAPLTSMQIIAPGGHPELSPSRISMIPNVRNENKVVNSWLKAETAIREERTQKITAKGNVIFYNDKN